MVRKAAVALALARALATASGADAQAPAKSPEAAVKAFADKYGDELVATSELMMWIGTCEPFLDKKTVDFYLSEFAVTDAPTEDFLSHGLANLHMKMYLRGRKDRASINYDRDQCQDVLNEVVREAMFARTKRKAREAVP